MTRPSTRIRAALLIELLIALILLGVLAVVITDLFVICTKTQRDSAKYEELIHHADSAIHSLRRDIWGAASIKLTAPGQVEIISPTNAAVTWLYRPNGSLSRTAGGTTQIWTGLPPITFLVDSPLVKLNFQVAPGRSESLTLASAQIIAGGRR